MTQPEPGKEFDRSILDATPELNLPAHSEMLDTDEGFLIGAWADLPENIRTRDLRWINDIVTHIDAIRSYTAHGQSAFDDLTSRGVMAFRCASSRSATRFVHYPHSFGLRPIPTRCGQFLGCVTALPTITWP